jgi:hypothetical protein
MKIWITRSNAFSIQCGGLQRLHVWFSKPHYVLVPYEEKDRDTPFGYWSDSHGFYREHGWETLDKRNQVLSFGDYFGYTDENEDNEELATFIWNKVQEHFKNRHWDDWWEMEKSGEIHKKDFLLEIDIEIKIKL